MGTAAKEQEMQIDGHALWGHDFKFLVNPVTGKKTNFQDLLITAENMRNIVNELNKIK